MISLRQSSTHFLYKVFSAIYFKIAIYLLSIIVVGVYVWSLSRGVEISDEAFNLLALSNPNLLGSSFWAYFVPWAEPFSLVQIRIIVFAIKLFAIAIFSFGLYGLIVRYTPGQNNRIPFSLLFSLVCIAVFGFIHPSIVSVFSYNVLNLVFILLSLGFTLIALSLTDTHTIRLILFLFLAAFFAGFIPFVKITASLFLVIPLLLVLFDSDFSGWSKKLMIVAVYSAGILTAFLLFFLTLCDFDTFLSLTLGQASGIDNDSQHGLSYFLLWSKRALYLTTNSLITAFAILYIRKWWNNSSVSYSATVVLISCLTLFFVDKNFLLGDSGFHSSLPFLILLIYAFFHSVDSSSIAINRWIQCILFCLVPYVASLGTNVPFNHSASLYGFAWIIPLFLIAIYRDDLFLRSMVLLLLIISVTKFTTYIYTECFWMSNHKLSEKTIDIRNHGFDQSLLLDAATLAVVKDIRDSISHYGAPKQYIPSNSYLFGYVYLLNGYIPGYTYFSLNEDVYLNYLKNNQVKLENCILMDSESTRFSEVFLTGILQLYSGKSRYKVVEMGSLHLYEFE